MTNVGRVEGSSLDERIKSGSIAVSEALKLAHEISESHKAEHGEGIMNPLLI